MPKRCNFQSVHQKFSLPRQTIAMLYKYPLRLLYLINVIEKHSSRTQSSVYPEDFSVVILCDITKIYPTIQRETQTKRKWELRIHFVCLCSIEHDTIFFLAVTVNSTNRNQHNITVHCSVSISMSYVISNVFSF